MAGLRLTLLVLDLLLTAAIAGFFYAYSSTVMRGLDAAPPEAAITAMNAINANVRNVIFAPSFFGPAIVGLLLVATYRLEARPSAWLARAAFLVYLLGGFALTLVVNVPMNEALAASATPADPEAARSMWAQYSEPWTAWNTARTFVSFASFALLLAAFAAEMRLFGRG